MEKIFDVFFGDHGPYLGHYDIDNNFRVKLKLQGNTKKEISKISLEYNINNDSNLANEAVIKIKKYLHSKNFHNRTKNIMINEKMFAHIYTDNQNQILYTDIYHSDYSLEYEDKLYGLNINDIYFFGHHVNKKIYNITNIKNKIISNHGLQEDVKITTSDFDNKFYKIIADIKKENLNLYNSHLHELFKKIAIVNNMNFESSNHSADNLSYKESFIDNSLISPIYLHFEERKEKNISYVKFILENPNGAAKNLKKFIKFYNCENLRLFGYELNTAIGDNNYEINDIYFGIEDESQLIKYAYLYFKTEYEMLSEIKAIIPINNHKISEYIKNEIIENGFILYDDQNENKAKNNLKTYQFGNSLKLSVMEDANKITITFSNL